jgi:transposase-like protein
MVQMVSDNTQDQPDAQGATQEHLEGQSEKPAQKARSSVEPGRELVTLPELPALPAKYHAVKALPEGKRLELLDAVLAHYENGASIYALAEHLGVNNATLYRNLKRYKRDDWIEVTNARYESEIEAAEKELREAPDAIAVTRARERIASARWKLERLDRRNYGQEQAHSGGNAVQINISLRRDAITVENAE